LTFWTVGQNLDEPDQFHAKKSRANQPGFVVFGLLWWSLDGAKNVRLISVRRSREEEVRIYESQDI
jgi:hypothetical protein